MKFLSLFSGIGGAVRICRSKRDYANNRSLNKLLYASLAIGETMTQVVMIHNIVEGNGKTIKENNLAKTHNIPIGSLVEAQWDEWFSEGACWKVHARLWVVAHNRDCDGTPLYSLSRWKDPSFALQVKQTHNGFGEESLSTVEVTPEVQRGDNVLEW